MKLSCLGFALLVGALINNSAFLERKQHMDGVQSEKNLVKASPLALAPKWRRFVNLPWNQRSRRRHRWAGGSTGRLGVWQRKDGPQEVAHLLLEKSNTQLASVEWSLDYWSSKLESFNTETPTWNYQQLFPKFLAVESHYFRLNPFRFCNNSLSPWDDLLIPAFPGPSKHGPSPISTASPYKPASHPKPVPFLNIPGRCSLHQAFDYVVFSTWNVFQIST